jgi:hypothetical protein
MAQDETGVLQVGAANIGIQYRFCRINIAPSPFAFRISQRRGHGLLSFCQAVEYRFGFCHKFMAKIIRSGFPIAFQFHPLGCAVERHQGGRRRRGEGVEDGGFEIAKI